MRSSSSVTDGAPVELDASSHVEKVLLSTPSGQWELLFFPKSSNRHYWEIVEVVGSENSRKEVVRYLNLEKDAVLPLGTVQSASRDGIWNVVISYDVHMGQINYPLLNQTEADKFQRLITGYETRKRFKSVACHVTLKSGWRSIRDGQDGGTGEVQLWSWPTTSKARNTQRSPPPQSTHRPGSVSSTILALSESRRGTSIQSSRGGEIAVYAAEPPPVLAFFAEEQGRYMMFKIDITALKIQPSESGLHLRRDGGTFPVERLSVTKLEQWNLSAMRPTIKGPSEKLEGTFVSLEFQNTGEEARFVEALSELHPSHQVPAGGPAGGPAGEVGSRRPSFQGSVPTALPQSPYSSPRAPAVDRRMSTSSFISLPHIRSSKPLTPSIFGFKSEPQSRRESAADASIPELDTRHRSRREGVPTYRPGDRNTPNGHRPQGNPNRNPVDAFFGLGG